MVNILAAYQTKGFDAKCLCCGKWYLSEGADKDFGQCSNCHFKESQELLKLKVPNLKKPVKRVYPHYLGEARIAQILDIYHRFCSKKLNQVVEEVNDRLNISITVRELTALRQKEYVNSKKGVKKCKN